MKKKWVVLMLFSLTLSLGMTLATAADPPANQTIMGDQGTVANNTVDTTKNIEQTDDQQLAAGEPAKNTPALTAVTATPTKAAGESYTAVKTSASGGTTVTVTDSQIKSAANSVKNFIEKNNRLPSYVTIGDKNISLSQYLQLICQETVNLSGSAGSLTVKNVSGPVSPSETVKSGNVQESEYLKLARNILNFMDENGRAPNYASSSLGNIRYESLIYTFSKVVAFHNTQGRLPNYVSVKSWTSQTGGNNTSSALNKYLVATANAQSNSSTIINLAATITNGKTTTLAKAQAIFNWVRDNLTYSFYYNTKKGALGALSSRTANCVDTSHLVVALARAAGIPARYQHGYCRFSDGWFGHVWAQLYVDGKWYYADAISDSNTLGTIKNWNLSTYTLYGTYASLPF